MRRPCVHQTSAISSQRRQIEPVRRRPAGRHLDPRHVPPLLEAGFLRARAELHARNLRRVAERGERQPGFGEALAAVVAGGAQPHGDRLGDVVALDRRALDHHHEAPAVGQVLRDLDRLRGRQMRVLGREEVHEEVRTEQQHARGRQQQRLPQPVLDPEPVHRHRGEDEHRQRRRDDDADELRHAVDVDQQQLRIEDPDERQDHGAQRVQRALDARSRSRSRPRSPPRRTSRAPPAA